MKSLIDSCQTKLTGHVELCVVELLEESAPRRQSRETPLQGRHQLSVSWGHFTSRGRHVHTVQYHCSYTHTQTQT